MFVSSLILFSRCTEVPEAVVRASQQLASPVTVASQPYPFAEDVQRDSDFCRLRINSHRHSFTCWKGKCPACRMSYPVQFLKRTYFTNIVPDPITPNDLVPTSRHSIGNEE